MLFKHDRSNVSCENIQHYNKIKEYTYILFKMYFIYLLYIFPSSHILIWKYLVTTVVINLPQMHSQPRLYQIKYPQAQPPFSEITQPIHLYYEYEMPENILNDWFFFLRDLAEIWRFFFWARGFDPRYLLFIA